MAHLQQWFYKYMIGLFSDETYGAMINYDGGDNEKHKYKNYDNNEASISGSDDLITRPWYFEVGLVDDMHVRGALCIYPFKDVP